MLGNVLSLTSDDLQASKLVHWEGLLLTNGMVNERYSCLAYYSFTCLPIPSEEGSKDELSHSQTGECVAQVETARAARARARAALLGERGCRYPELLLVMS